jgi:Flp pilus assembly CpaF family ATPase
MENQNTQNLAEKIARLLQTEMQSADNSIQSSLKKINQRLDAIELNIAFQNPKSKVQNLKSNHLSQDKFTNLEEIADEIIAGMEQEKACPYEPTGKPCDHCAMCSSRGF